MEIYIIDEKQKCLLFIFDRKTGIEWTQDLIGNSGGLNIKEIDGETVFAMTRKDFDWWQEIIEMMDYNEDIREKIEKSMNGRFGDLLQEAIEEASNPNDYAIHVHSIQQLLEKCLNANGLIKVNGSIWAVTWIFEETPIWAMYSNRNSIMVYSLVEPEDIDWDSIANEWKKISSIDEFGFFVRNIPNKSGYLGYWKNNREYFMKSFAVEL